LITAICLISALPLKAQVEKGKILASVSTRITHVGDWGSELMSLGFYNSKYYGGSDTYKDISFNLQPRVGYFVINNLATGIDIIVASTSEKNKNDADYKWSETLLGIGPFIRYYHPLEKVYPFAEASAIFGSAKEIYNDDEQKWSVMMISLGIGGAFPLGDRVTFDALLNYSHTAWKDKDQEAIHDETIRGVGLRLGFTLFFF
jgi:hypothetical protein